MTKAFDRVLQEAEFIESQKRNRAFIRETKDDPRINIDHPPHYNNGDAECTCGRKIECIDVTRHLNFNLGNAIKYLWRCDHKVNAIEDLEKAIWYIKDEIQKRKWDKKVEERPIVGGSIHVD